MATTFSCKASFNAYLDNQKKFCDDTGNKASKLENLLMIGQYAPAIGTHVNNLQGNTAAAKKCNDVSNGFGAGRSVLGFIRVIFPLESLLTGKIWYQRYSDKDVRKAREGNYYQSFMVKGAFIKVALKEDGNPNEVPRPNGKPRLDYVPENADGGVYLRRDWLEIAQDVLVLAARCLSPLTWLNNFKAIDLGKHAKGIGMAIGGLWASILTLNLIEKIRNTIKSEDNDPESLRKQFVDILSAIVTFLTIPFDCFSVGAGMNAHPVVGLVGAILCLLDPLISLLKEIMYYS